MNTLPEKLPDTTMIAASETARRNPMRPPDTLPRDARSALRVFLTHPSPLLIASYAAILIAWRLGLGNLGWGDAFVALAIWAYFPFNEWLIHVFMLHFKPFELFGRTVDFYLPKTHRRHHADPWNLKWVFIPRHIHFWTVPEVALILWVLWPWKELAMTGLVTYLLLGLHYEWVHFLAHIPWSPSKGVIGAYYQRRVREHRYHHFRNEGYWWGVSFGFGDRVLRTAPAVEEVGRSGTTATLGMPK
ncbi:MAG TPA: sterol desaturase family protein [Verrucomicrobiae bacterium]|nr:sterol desaturase family protein [Verrucomicrobiae bacterium]